MGKEKERQWDVPDEGRKNHREFVNGIFVFRSKIWTKTRHKIHPLCKNKESSFYLSCQILEMYVISLYQLTEILKMYLTKMECIVSLRCQEAA